jgi:ADP-ribose pyrophosphatase YjhB (NUDIX family)
MTWKPHVTVAAIVEHQQHYLLVEEDIDGHRVFNQPAGHLEQGEDLIQAIQREMLEETARAFRVDALVGIYLYELEEKQRSYLRFCFCGQAGEILSGHSLDREIVATHWLTLDEIHERQARLRSPMVLQCIQDYMGGRRIPTEDLHYLLP